MKGRFSAEFSVGKQLCCVGINVAAGQGFPGAFSAGTRPCFDEIVVFTIHKEGSCFV